VLRNLTPVSRRLALTRALEIHKQRRSPDPSTRERGRLSRFGVAMVSGLYAKDSSLIRF
jgi:hypothetical protein